MELKDLFGKRLAWFSSQKRALTFALAGLPLALAISWQLAQPQPLPADVVPEPMATAAASLAAVTSAPLLASADPALPAPTATVAAAAAEATPTGPKQTISHVVREGETLSDIADHYGVTGESVVWANEDLDDPHALSVGQKLLVPPVTGVLHTVRAGDTLLEVAEQYEAKLVDVVAANALSEPYPIAVGQLLIVPGGRPPAPLLAMAVPERAEPASRGGEERAAPTPTPAATVVPVAGLSAEQAAFIGQLIGPAQRSQRETGVPASVTIAQAIWESEWGRSGLARRANNYFGIKGRPNPGPAGVIWLETWEVVNGRTITVTEPFKVYNSLLESILDHGVFIAHNSRYAQAMKNRADPKTFIRLVHQAGYATDPAYTDKIVRLLDRYNLYVYDL